MEKAKFIEQVCKIENQNDFYSVEVDGHKIWPIFRFFIIEKIFEKMENKISHPDLKINYFNFNNGLSLLYNSFFKFNYKKNKNISHLFYFCLRKRKNENGYYSPLIDSVIDEIGSDDYLLIERSMPNLGHINNFKDRNIIFSDQIELYRFLGLLKYKKSKKCDNWYNQIYKLLEILEHQINIDVEIPELRSRVVHTLATFFIAGKRINNVLKYLKPKYLIIGPHYELNTMMLVFTCHKLNIKVVELQHGYIGPTHWGYNYNFDYEKYKMYFPNKILVFGEFWKNSVNFPNKENILIPTGFPEFDENGKKLTIDSSSKKVLFISESNGKNNLSSLCCKLSKHKKFESYTILYKMHPNECRIWKEMYPELVGLNNVKVIDSSDKNVYEYFAQSILVVGTESTVLYESIGFGLFTCIFDIIKETPLREFENKDSLKFIKNSDDIISILEELKNGDFIGDSSLKEYFFRPNAVRNIIKELE